MAIMPRERKIGTMILVVVVGILIGSYLNTLLVALLPQGNVVKTFFTYNFISFGVGDFASNKPLLIDLDAIKFQFGFQLKFSLLSIIGLFISLYLFRWYE